MPRHRLTYFGSTGVLLFACLLLYHPSYALEHQPRPLNFSQSKISKIDPEMLPPPLASSEGRVQPGTVEKEEECSSCPQLCDTSAGQERCVCFRGFKPSPSPLLCKDIDECAETPGLCGPRGRCINTLGGFVCRCPQRSPQGHGPPGSRCPAEGHDPCSSSPCEQICHSLPKGGYSCGCHRGYTPQQPPGPRCVDINECSSQRPCSHLCANTVGSFLCRCPAPLHLSSDLRSCEPAKKQEEEDEEEDPPGKRHRKSPSPHPTWEHLTSHRDLLPRDSPQPVVVSRFPESREEDLPLVDSAGRPPCQPRCLHGGLCHRGTCVCPPGLTGDTCHKDVDECSSLPAELRCSHECRNSFGSFQCACPEGWVLGADRRSCAPLACSPPCSHGGVCEAGTCRCPPGLQGPACEIDVDECDQSPCAHVCRNTLGSFACLCRGRWRLAADGRGCTEPPCSPPCRHGGVCRAGRCHCEPGFHGRLCQLDFNECLSRDTPCRHACVNTPGSFQCLCPPGERLAANRTACLPAEQHAAPHTEHATEEMAVMIEVLVEDAGHSLMARYTQGPMHLPSYRVAGHNAPMRLRHHHHHPSKNKPYPIISTSILSTSSRVPPLIAAFRDISPSAVYLSPTPVSSPSPISTLLKPYLSSVISQQVAEPSRVESHASHVSEQAEMTPALPHVIPSENLILHTTMPLSSIEEVSSLFPSATPAREMNFSTPSYISYMGEPEQTEPSNLVDSAQEERTITEEPEVELTDAPPNEIFPLPLEPSSVSLTEYLTENTNFDIIQDIANSLFPSHTLASSRAENFTESLTSESQITDNILPSPVLAPGSSVSEIPTVAPKKVTKPKKKKHRKTRPKTGGKFGKDLQILNQILQTFDLPRHEAGEGGEKQYEVIDFDELPPAELPSRAVKNSSGASLPVLKAPLTPLTNNTIRPEIDCYYNRKRFKSRSSFFRDEKNCTKCVCKDGELRCAPRHCPPVHCESPLQSDCCAYCPGDCVLEQQVYLPGERFSPYLDPCRECRCQSGRAVCEDIVCPPLSCPPQYRAQLPGECCPVCVPPEPGCFWNGRFFYTGQLWVHRQGGCHACLCKAENEVQCNPVVCVVECQHPQFVTGDCCPLCEGCQHHGRRYNHAETFIHPTDPCSSCQCQYGNITCFEKPCEKKKCGHPYKPPGSCCGECKDCHFEGEHIRDGAVHTFSNSNGTCMNCTCKEGEVSCTATECLAGCEMEPGGHRVASGSQFSLASDPCTRCRCHEGHLECRAQPCLTHCSHGLLLSGACCLDCTRCEYQGKIYRDLEVFRPSDEPCLSCLCARGNALCNDSCGEEALDSDEDEDFEEEDEEEE